MKVIYNVLDYGAKASAEELQSPFIQKAIDECAKNGGGEVIIPTGTFLIGSLYMRSHVTLHLLEDAVLLGSIVPDDYTDFPEMQTNKYECILAQPLPLDRELRKNRALVSSINCEDMSIIGEKGATFDGRNCFDELGEENLRGPRGFLFFDCKNMEFYGFKLANSANHAFVVCGCENVYAHNVEIEGGHDGFGLGFSHNVLVENCKVVCGDDCFAFAFSKSITIKDCDINTNCNLFRIAGCDVLIDNCNCQGPAVYGHRLTLTREQVINRESSKGKGRRNICSAFCYFSYVPRCPELTAPHRNIVMQNCTFDQVDCLAMFHYDENLHQTWQNLESITLKNCTATNIQIPVIMRSGKENPTTVRLENVHLSAGKGFENREFMVVEDCKEIVLHNVTLEGFNENKLISLNGKPNLTALGCDEFKIVEQ